MELTFNEKTNTRSLLSSWKSGSDPSLGRFTAGINHRKLTEIFIWDGDHPYWRSGPWDGHVFIGVRSMYYFAPVDKFHFENDKEGTFSLSFSFVNERITQHYILTHDGVVLQKDWNDDKGDWTVLWQSLESETECVCDMYGKCGEFGSCNSHNSPICSCLRGFEPSNIEEWSAGNWSSGCVRRTTLQCGTIRGVEDGFLRFRNMKVPDNAEWLLSDDEQNCKRLCLKNCLCSSYAYRLGFGCMIWNGSLIDIQDFSPVGVDLFIRLARSELGDQFSVSDSFSCSSCVYVISDFGTARIFESNQDQGDTQSVVGTYGYMSPEYAMEGRFSEKSDVFSFGVLLLEIVSGRRNNSFTDEDTWSLLSHAWKLWNEDDILSLIDPTISGSTFQLEILKCIQVGLLSVQEFPEDRPSIAMVVSMIESEVIELPRPTQPGFTLRRIVSLNEAQRNGRECFSVNGVSISCIGGR
uniref:Uncharacterized protein n=1 Tax=Chenopodium quinoa TaxID=63459 RepID=A0A803LL34_CHEQI